MSGTPINLNRFRKEVARADRRARANENAVRFGRTKAEKARDAEERDRAEQRLDQHRRDSGE